MNSVFQIRKIVRTQTGQILCIVRKYTTLLTLSVKKYLWCEHNLTIFLEFLALSRSKFSTIFMSWFYKEPFLHLYQHWMNSILRIEFPLSSYWLLPPRNFIRMALVLHSTSTIAAKKRTGNLQLFQYNIVWD